MMSENVPLIEPKSVLDANKDQSDWNSDSDGINKTRDPSSPAFRGRRAEEDIEKKATLLIESPYFGFNQNQK